MISVYKIKPAFQNLLRPILRGLYKGGVTANQITLTSILLSLGLGIIFLYYPKHHWLLLMTPLGLLIRMALNALDGMMAREYKMQSKIGEVLNELGDILSDSFIFFPLMIIPSANPLIIIAFAVLAIVNEFTGLLGRAMGGERRYDGPMGKSDRAFFVSVYCIVYYFWTGVEVYTDWIFGAASLLVILSTLIRARKAIQ